MSSFYSEEELEEIGFLEYGKNVLLSRNAKIYGASKIIIGDNVRIDDFCILSGKIVIKNNVHISAGVYIFSGNAGVILDDFSSISSRSVIYAVSDDYSGEYLANPTVDEEFKHVIEKPVYIGRHSLIATGCTILPGVTIPEDVSVGAMSLVNKDLEPYSIYVGVPCAKIKDKSKKVFELEKEFVAKKVKKL